MKVQWTKPSYPLTVTCIFYLTCWILDRTFSTYIAHTYAIFCCLHIWKKNYFIHEMIHLLNLNKKTNRLYTSRHTFNLHWTAWLFDCTDFETFHPLCSQLQWPAAEKKSSLVGACVFFSSNRGRDSRARAQFSQITKIRQKMRSIKFVKLTGFA